MRAVRALCQLQKKSELFGSGRRRGKVAQKALQTDVD